MSFTTLITIIYIFIFFFGASIFSFVNVLVYRVPRHMSFGNERSICPKCGHQLNALDLIPVLGWVFLGGKCRYCGDKISRRYPAVETLGGVLSVFTMMKYQEVMSGGYLWIGRVVITFLFFAMLAAITFVDMNTMEIPNEFVFSVLVCGIISIGLFPNISLASRGIGFLCVSVPLFLITLAIPGAFGGGDIKLMAAAGVFLGWQHTVFALVFGIFTGGIYGAYLLVSKKKERKDHFAFGPFLCTGMVAAIFVGDVIINWYLSLLV